MSSLKDALDLLNVSMEQGNALYRNIVKKMFDDPKGFSGRPRTRRSACAESGGHGFVDDRSMATAVPATRARRRIVERVADEAIATRAFRGLEFGGSGEDSFVAVVVTKLTGALLFILLLTMVIMALLPKAVDLPSDAGRRGRDARPRRRRPPRRSPRRSPAARMSWPSRPMAARDIAAGRSSASYRKASRSSPKRA